MVLPNLKIIGIVALVGAASTGWFYFKLQTETIAHQNTKLELAALIAERDALKNAKADQDNTIAFLQEQAKANGEIVTGYIAKNGELTQQLFGATNEINTQRVEMERLRRNSPFQAGTVSADRLNNIMRQLSTVPTDSSEESSGNR